MPQNVKTVCDVMDPATAVDVAVAERAVKASEATIREMSHIAQTEKIIDEKTSQQYIQQAEKDLDDAKMKMEKARAKSVFVRSACEGAKTIGGGSREAR